MKSYLHLILGLSIFYVEFRDPPQRPEAFAPAPSQRHWANPV